MSTYRKHYRAAPEPELDLRVAIIGVGDHLHPARILDVSGGGMRVVVTEDPPEHAILGKVYQVRLTSTEFPAPINAPVIVVQSEQDGAALLLALQFLDWMGLAAIVPASFAPLFNLRIDPRLTFDPAIPVEVIVRGIDDAFELRGILCDVSRSGLCFSASLLSQCALSQSDYCVVQFTPPGLDRRFSFGSCIRYRALNGESLRYGVWFDRDYTEGFALQQAALSEYVDLRIESVLRNLIVK